MSPWGVSRDGNKPLPLGHRFSIFRFLSSPSLLMARNPHSSFSPWSIAYSVGPHLNLLYSFIDKSLLYSRRPPFLQRSVPQTCFSLRGDPTRPDYSSPNSPKRSLRRPDEGPLRWIRDGSASAQCFPAFVLPRGIMILRLFPKTIYWQTNSSVHCLPFIWPEGGNGTSMETPERISPKQRWNRNSII